MAIEARIAFLPGGTAGTNGAAAVNVSFLAVLPMVRALISNAYERNSVAGVARAIGIDFAAQPKGAGRASAAAAVNVGFLTVFSMVCALTAHASSTTMDIYAQFVPEWQRRSLAKMSAMVEARTSKPIAPASIRSTAVPPQSQMVN